ncbi:MlaD family protein [Arenicella xantha]|uniref:MlaD protein n=1 Tax=Arenicella xantha TaxID=644221 RepID=A0A395JNA1_9GAMM|nr:MlaD family protein [Arenicella xantha]RBP53140.1 MlaD protein [Arenicella xantha]
MFQLNRNTSPLALLSLILLSALLSACSNDSLDVVVEFNNTRDIKAGTDVHWQGSTVGEVSAVDLSDGVAQVHISLDPVKAKEISSEAAIVVNRVKPGAPLEIHNPTGPIAQALQAGQTLHGMDSMLELMAWSVGDALNAGGKQLSSMVTGFQSYVQGEEFQRSKDQLQQQMTDAVESTGSALKTLEQGFADSIEDMAATEEQLAGAINDLSEELAPMVQEMSRSSAELAKQVDQFVLRMENATPEERASGERLMQSLVDMIDKLNSSMESGATSAPDATQNDRF